jgi:antitoxin (DNA-binding transcriptional repressor) of toxin-antitoxin stability system
MSIYIDLQQTDLSLATLQRYLQMGEELILTDTQRPIAKIVSLEKAFKNYEDTMNELRQIISQPAKCQLLPPRLNTETFCFNRVEANER